MPEQAFVDPRPFKNIAEFFLARLAASPDEPAISYPIFDPANPAVVTEWKSLTWKEYGDRVRCVAAGLLSLGFKKGHRLALYAPTTLPWVLIDAAVLCIGGISVPIYETTTAKEVQAILLETETPFLFVQNQRAWEMALDMLHSLPDLQKVITSEIVTGDSEIQIDMKELEARGLQGLQRANMLGPNAKEGDLLKHASQNVEGERGACIYHTSGTTGVPQPISISQKMLLAQIRQVFQVFASQFKSGEVGLTMLPYSHIFGRIEWLCHIAFGGHGFGTPGFQYTQEYLRHASPTILFTVPRVLEKIRQRIYEEIAELSGIKRLIAEKSLALAEGESGGGGLKGLLADRLVFGKIKDALGGRLHTMIIAGAPLSPDLARFFGALGVKVIEAYGLTETTGAVSVTTGEESQFGTVGKPLPETQIRLAHDGEIFVQGPQVFRGYGMSIDEGKREEIFVEEWFRTGDLGEWDEKNCLKITGRKKDLIITAAGKNIAPQKIEMCFATEPVFDQVIVLGENKPYLVAFFVLNRDLLAAALNNREMMDETWVQSPAVFQWVAERVNEINSTLAPFETIKRFAILPQGLSSEKKELTLSQKPRRQTILHKYKDLFESLYQEEPLG